MPIYVLIGANQVRDDNANVHVFVCVWFRGGGSQSDTAGSAAADESRPVLHLLLCHKNACRQRDDGRRRTQEYSPQKRASTVGELEP